MIVVIAVILDVAKLARNKFARNKGNSKIAEKYRNMAVHGRSH